MALTKQKLESQAELVEKNTLSYFTLALRVKIVISIFTLGFKSFMKTQHTLQELLHQWQKKLSNLKFKQSHLMLNFNLP